MYRFILLLLALLFAGCSGHHSTKPEGNDGPALTLTQVSGLAKTVADASQIGTVAADGSLNLGRAFKSISKYYVVNNNSDIPLYNVTFKSSNTEKIETATDTIKVLGIPTQSTDLIPLLQLVVRHGTSGLHQQADPLLWDGLTAGGQDIEESLTITWSTDSTLAATDSIVYQVTVKAMVTAIEEVTAGSRWVVAGNCSLKAGGNTWGVGDTLKVEQFPQFTTVNSVEGCINTFPTNEWFSIQ